MKTHLTCTTLAVAFCAALFTPSALAEAAALPPPLAEHALLRLMWRESQGSILLVRAEKQPGDAGNQLNTHPFKRMHDEPHTLLFTRVQHSTTAEVKPGTLVLLELQATVAHMPESEWMLVAMRGDAVSLTADGSALFIPGYDWNMCPASELLQHADALQGIWKEMADVVRPPAPTCSH